MVRERLQRRRAAADFGGKQLEAAVAMAVGEHDLGSAGHAGQQRDFAVQGEAQQLVGATRGDHEARPGLFRSGEGPRVEHGAGADAQVRALSLRRRMAVSPCVVRRVISRAVAAGEGIGHRQDVRLAVDGDHRRMRASRHSVSMRAVFCSRLCMATAPPLRGTNGSSAARGGRREPASAVRPRPPARRSGWPAWTGPGSPAAALRRRQHARGRVRRWCGTLGAHIGRQRRVPWGSIARSRPGLFGNSEAVWPSSPMPRTSTSIGNGSSCR